MKMYTFREETDGSVTYARGKGGGRGALLPRFAQPAARSPPGIYRPHKMHSCIYGCYKNAIPSRSYDFQKS